MRFMIIRKADQQTEAGAMPTEEMLALMGNYMQEMTEFPDDVQQAADNAAVKAAVAQHTR